MPRVHQKVQGDSVEACSKIHRNSLNLTDFATIYYWQHKCLTTPGTVQIAKTEEFFHNLGIKTRLADHGINEEGIDKIIDSLKKHGMTALSETGKVTPEISRQILMMAL